MLTPASLAELQACLAELGLDGWLLADFQGTNPIAVGMLRFSGMLSRRHLAFVPRTGPPIAIGHGVERWPWQHWPSEWLRIDYVGWRELEAVLTRVVRGKRVAMEYCPGDAIPYLDRVPAGTVDLVRRAGAEVVSSADLVTRFYARWTDAQLASHERSAERLADIARRGFAMVGERSRSAAGLAEHDLQRWLIDAIEAAGLEAESPPMVAAGAHTADVHYEPSADRPRRIGSGDILLVDLWGREAGGPYADQTWMAVLGPPPRRVLEVWDAERAARDAAIALLRSRIATGAPIRGSEVHEEARRVLEARGLLEHAKGRAGHSIDARQLHGAGPNLDCVETPDDRLLVPGICFSIEPGVYIDGEFGMRSEVNAFIAPTELRLTPRDMQTELWVL